MAKTAPRLSDRPSFICRLANRAVSFSTGRGTIACNTLYLAACFRRVGAIKVLLKAGAKCNVLVELILQDIFRPSRGMLIACRHSLVLDLTLTAEGEKLKQFSMKPCMAASIWFGIYSSRLVGRSLLTLGTINIKHHSILLQAASQLGTKEGN